MATVEVNTACCASILSRWHYTLYLQGGHTLAPHSRRRGAKHNYYWEAGRARDQKGIALENICANPAGLETEPMYSAQKWNKIG